MQAIDISNVFIPKEHQKNTPKNYRRRLLELAEHLESISDSAWCYKHWLKNEVQQEVLDTGHACGTAACALGHATDIPEAFQAGIRFRAVLAKGLKYVVFDTDEAPGFYGLSDSEFNYLFFAANPAPSKGLPLLCIETSSRLDVAKAIRALSDIKYPAPTTHPAPAPKTKRVEKPGTKRWCAQKLREAAKWIEDHGWCQANYFKYADGQLCGCAHGGIASVSNTDCQLYLANVAVNTITPQALSAAVASEAGWAAGAARAKAAGRGDGKCPTYVKEKDAWMVHYYATLYGVTFAFNDAFGRTKEQVCRQLMAAAYAVEHGGTLPTWAPSMKVAH